MKILGILLMLAGILCATLVVTGLFAWTTVVPEGSSPASVASAINWKMITLSALGVLFFAGGFFALIPRGR